MAHTISKRRSAKAKKSYTLSPESVAYLDTLRRQRRARSVSSVLEDILQSVQRAEKRKTVETAVSEYYGSLGEKQLDEQAKWGDFAWAEFSKQNE